MSDQKKKGVDPMQPVSIPPKTPTEATRPTKKESEKQTRTNLAFQRRYATSKRNRFAAGPIIVGIGFLALAVVASITLRSNQSSLDVDGRVANATLSDTRRNSLSTVSPDSPSKFPTDDRSSQTVDRNGFSSDTASENQSAADIEDPQSATEDATEDATIREFHAENSDGKEEVSEKAKRIASRSIEPDRKLLSPEDLKRLAELLKSARQAIDDGDFSRAENNLDDATSIATSDGQIAMVKRLETLAEYVQEFWKSVEASMDDIEGAELEFNDEHLYVVSCDAKSLVLRMRGKNRTYSREALPPKLTILLADRWFNQDAASTKVFKGAYMAVEPKFGKDAARKLWQAAAQEGADIGDLFLVLDDVYEVEILGKLE